jgi:hypothetical protein
MVSVLAIRPKVPRLPACTRLLDSSTARNKILKFLFTYICAVGSLII